MAISRATYEQQLLDELRDVPLRQFPQVIHLLHVIKEEFLTECSRSYTAETKAAGGDEMAKAISAVEETWCSIPLDREMAKYFAEDKELEYDVE